MRWKRIHGVLHTSLWRQRAPSREQGTLRGETPDCLCEVGTGGFGGGHPEKDKPLAIGCFWLEALRAQWVPLEARPWNLGFISSECWLQRLQCTCCPVGPGDWGGGRRSECLGEFQKTAAPTPNANPKGETCSEENESGICKDLGERWGGAFQNM